MDIWKGTFIPLRKHVTDAGFIDEIPDLDSDPGTDEYWEQYDEEYGHTLATAKNRAEGIKKEITEETDTEEILGILFVSLDGEYTLNYLSNFKQYLDFEQSGFDTDYYNENIRITPFPLPFGPRKS